jgi:hypothetical protein
MRIVSNNLPSKIIKKISYGFATLLIIIFPLSSPILVSADSSCTPPSGGPGVTKPVGAGANMFTYNCTSGLWVSAHYSYNPATGAYTPLDPVVYTYDAATGEYDYTTWQYDAATANYQQDDESIATPPAGATVVGAPAPTPPAKTGSDPSDTGSGDQAGDTGTASDDTSDGSTGSVGDTGTGSTNGVDGSSTNDTTDDNNNSLTVDNTLTQTATSGDASVLDNTNGGDATSGDATDIADVMNLLQSSSDNLAGNAVTFVSNIDGTVDGNLIFDPSQLANVQPAADSSTTTNNDLTINNSTDASIDNNLTLNADSGNATVADNTNGGSATSGTAESIANVVNMIDSAVTSGQSFLGVININGDLNGNIEVPSDFVNQMLADNVPTVDIDEGNSQTDVNNTNNEDVTNNVNTAATTGTASVSQNTNGGSATSGSATTNITAFNLTGSSVVGANDLLVFVNVVGGSWVGLIVNSPAGATAAEMGGGITSDTTNTSQTDNNTNNLGITNTINEDSKSGDATVSQNTNGGNATTGNSDDAVNLLNVEHSSLSLSNWFGILFINVFGTWNGSFGTTSDFATTTTSSTGGTGSIVATPLASFVSKNNAKVIAPNNIHSYLDYGSSSTSNGAGSPSSQTNTLSKNAVLASDNLPSSNASTSHVNIAKSGHVKWSLIAGGVLMFTAYIVGDQYFTTRHKSNK